MSSKRPKRKSCPNVDEYGRTALHYAAIDGNETEVKKLLLSGENPSLQDDNGWTPLHFAAQSVSADITNMLIEAGSDIHLKDSFGNTPLHNKLGISYQCPTGCKHCIGKLSV